MKLIIIAVFALNRLEISTDFLPDFVKNIYAELYSFHVVFFFIKQFIFLHFPNQKLTDAVRVPKTVHGVFYVNIFQSLDVRYYFLA